MFDPPVWASNNSVTSRAIEQQQINFHKQEKKTYERRIKKNEIQQTTIWNVSGFDLSNINSKCEIAHFHYMVLDMACHTSVYNITHDIAVVHSLTQSLLPRNEVAYVCKI